MNEEREKSRIIMTEVMEFIHDKKIHELDDFLFSLISKDISLRQKVSALRSSYVARKLLNNWKALAKHTYDKHKQMGEDVDGYFIGLDLH